MAIKFGFAGLNQNLNSTDTTTNLGGQISELFSKTLSVRVRDIILDDTHPDFNRYGGWNGVGTIFFEAVSFQTDKNNYLPVAKPFNPNFKIYPLINEIVYLIKLPDTNIGDQPSSESYYYLNTISMWNHPHHNAYPDLADEGIDPAQQKDYQDIEGGSVRRVSDKSTEINLNSPKIGGTFVEKSNIHPLLPFAGDTLIEGRFGNSVRLGNTSKTTSRLYKNNWSGAGENGDPITILRNGQPQDSSEEGWKPLIENINKDLSSIYLTSHQSIPLNSSFTSYPAIETPPESLGSYNKPQVILNSGRLVFNSNTDSIILNSKKSTSISSVEDVGLYSRNGGINLLGDKIRIGDTSASQSLVLGDTFMDQLSQFLISVSLLMDSLSSEPSLKIASLSAQNLKIIADEMKDQIPSFLSKISKTV